MSQPERDVFDFDEWAALAREDSSAFESRRQEYIASAIAEAPLQYRQRLLGLQFRIDMERQRAGTALGAAIRLNAMMWSSFEDLRAALNGLAHDSDAGATPKGSGATLIPFRKRS